MFTNKHCFLLTLKCTVFMETVKRNLMYLYVSFHHAIAAIHAFCRLSSNHKEVQSEILKEITNQPNVASKFPEPTKVDIRSTLVANNMYFYSVYLALLTSAWAPSWVTYSKILP